MLMVKAHLLLLLAPILLITRSESVWDYENKIDIETDGRLLSTAEATATFTTIVGEIGTSEWKH